MAQVYPALIGNALDPDVVSRSVRMSKAIGQVSFTDAMLVLAKYDVQPDDIVTVARGPPGSREVEVTFASTEIMAAFADSGPKSYRGSNFSITRYDKQLLEARVHWLPVNVKDTVLKQIFEGFGKIISITDEVTKYGTAQIKSGVRIVKLEVDEVGKSRVPHLLHFGCGRKALVTVRGRPPLCLRCHRVGHLRSGCPGTVANAGAGLQDRREVVRPAERTEEATGVVTEEMETVVEEEAEEKTEEKVEEVKEKVTEEKAEEKAEDVEREEDAVEEVMDVEVRGEKRSSSSAESGWIQIPPNKRKSGGSSGAGGAVGASDLTQELEAVLAEDPLTPVEGLSSAADDSVLEGLLAMQSPHA